VSERRSDFERDGYVACRRFLGTDELVALCAELSRVVRDVVPSMPRHHVFLEDAADAGSIKQLQQLHVHDPFFGGLIAEGRLPALAAELLGEPVRPVNLQFFDKRAAGSRPTPPHQDGFYFMLEPCRAVTMWLALEDVSEVQGCVRYVRGSHREGLRPHVRSGVLGFSQHIADYGAAGEVAREVAFPCQAGDLLAHDASTIHRADANRDPTQSRKALGFIYYAESARVDEARHAAYQERLAREMRRSG
jgi:phytanoyl-CoA hydroxylase